MDIKGIDTTGLSAEAIAAIQEHVDEPDPSAMSAEARDAWTRGLETEQDRPVRLQMNRENPPANDVSRRTQPTVHATEEPYDLTEQTYAVSLLITTDKNPKTMLDRLLSDHKHVTDFRVIGSIRFKQGD